MNIKPQVSFIMQSASGFVTDDCDSDDDSVVIIKMMAMMMRTLASHGGCLGNSR